MTSVQGDLLRTIVTLLHGAGIEHMIVGSLASSYHGVPRQTQDIDLVIEADDVAVRRFVGGLDADRFYADPQAAADAIERETSFNVVDRETGWKVDLIARRSRAFSREEMARKITVRILGTETQIATAEDTIIAKLEWASAGESERQIRDVAGIINAQRQALDRAYIDRWVAALGLADVWARATAAADEARRALDVPQ